MKMSNELVIALAIRALGTHLALQNIGVCIFSCSAVLHANRKGASLIVSDPNYSMPFSILGDFAQ